ncbi:MAG: hypothetical protein P3X24_006305 [bacterium]|nr:hypothetical protein [bacterium]
MFKTTKERIQYLNSKLRVLETHFFVVGDKEEIHYSEEWEEDFEQAVFTLTEADAVEETQMQVDSRYMLGEDYDAL